MQVLMTLLGLEWRKKFSLVTSFDQRFAVFVISKGFLKT